MKRYHSITVAVQFDEQAPWILQAARQLSCCERDCNIDLVHVCPHLTGYGEVGNHHHCGRALQLKQQLFPPLKQLAEQGGIAGHQIHILFGDVAEVLSTHLREAERELCVLGRNPGQQLQNLALLGHVSQRILEQAGCDLLVVAQAQQHWQYGCRE